MWLIVPEASVTVVKASPKKAAPKKTTVKKTASAK
jgi:hypothetical protein